MIKQLRKSYFIQTSTRIKGGKDFICLFGMLRLRKEQEMDAGCMTYITQPPKQKMALPDLRNSTKEIVVLNVHRYLRV